jgi:hypothetical protein
MPTGIFWIDTHPGQDLHLTIARAAAHFRLRFRKEPNICLVPPGSVGTPNGPRRALRILPCAGLPPHHVWIGVEEKQGPRAQSGGRGR